MIIGLVRDSVMQCFCHTCRVPVMPAVYSKNSLSLKKSNKTRSKQPQPRSSKKVKFITTEIRCQEKSKGGLSYEVILAEPSPNVTLPKRSGTSGKNMSVEQIEQKLRAAEERRIKLESKKIAEISTKLAKIDEASRKKKELHDEFIIQTKEQLNSKMEQHVEKRDAIISDLKEKLKVHSQEIEKTRNTLEQQKHFEKAAIDEKLKTAQSLRDENIKKMLERLKSHNTVKIAEIKSQLDTLVSKKLELNTRIIENKLYTAEQNREREIKKKLENIQKHERRAEMVRQNKASATSG